MCLLRIGALVVWRGQVAPIVNRTVRREGTTYAVHVKLPNGALETNYHLTLGLLMAELCQHARYCVGDTVAIGEWERTIQARWWSTRNGQIYYRINDQLDSGRSVVLTQEKLLARVNEQVEPW